jgi:hypothetical protein
MVDETMQARYTGPSNLLAELWLLRDWHRALNELSFQNRYHHPQRLGATVFSILL